MCFDPNTVPERFSFDNGFMLTKLFICGVWEVQVSDPFNDGSEVYRRATETEADELISFFESIGVVYADTLT